MSTLNRAQKTELVKLGQAGVESGEWRLVRAGGAKAGIEFFQIGWLRRSAKVCWV
jgi:hypothetical protein